MPCGGSSSLDALWSAERAQAARSGLCHLHCTAQPFCLLCSQGPSGDFGNGPLSFMRPLVVLVVAYGPVITADCKFPDSLGGRTEIPDTSGFIVLLSSMGPITLVSI